MTPTRCCSWPSRLLGTTVAGRRRANTARGGGKSVGERFQVCYIERFRVMTCNSQRLFVSVRSVSGNQKDWKRPPQDWSQETSHASKNSPSQEIKRLARIARRIRFVNERGSALHHPTLAGRIPRDHMAAAPCRAPSDLARTYLVPPRRIAWHLERQVGTLCEPRIQQEVHLRRHVDGLRGNSAALEHLARTG